MQIECDLIDDDGVSEFLSTDKNIEDESSNRNNEQTSPTLGLHTPKLQIINKRKLFVSPLKKNASKKIQRPEDPRINQAFDLLKTMEAKKKRTFN